VTRVATEHLPLTYGVILPVFPTLIAAGKIDVAPLESKFFLIASTGGKSWRLWGHNCLSAATILVAGGAGG